MTSSEESTTSSDDTPAVEVRREGNRIIVPGFGSAHSHAFQRAIRGLTQRRLRRGSEADFWSWREQMYRTAQQLTPERIHKISRYAFMEMAVAGYTAVGEFHYAHHQPDGTPYEDRIAMADAVIEAAREVGLRISLLRVVYERGGANQAIAPAQRMFADEDLDHAFYDIEKLQKKWQDDPFVRIGIAPHSVRAVTAETIQACAAFARDKDLPIHMHVAEQPREIQECVDEHGKRPVELLADLGALSSRFVAVHATHLESHEAGLLGESKTMVALCRTTERDLADGLPDVTALKNAGVRLCTGIDSHTITNPLEELRAIELDERVRTLKRCVVFGARELLEIASRNGYEAIGFGGEFVDDEVEIEPRDLALVGLDDDQILDGIIFSADLRAVRAVTVRTTCVGRGGTHPFGREFVEDYESVLDEIRE